MKTLILLSCCRTAQTTEWSPLINALPGICWGVIILCSILVGYYIYMRFKLRTDHVNQHEIKMKKLLNEYEEKMISINQDIKDRELHRKIREYNELTKLINNEDLERKIREYNELTIHKTLLEKATGIDKDFDDLKKAIEEMKKKYESLDGEIEKIIVKKKS